MTVIRSQRPLAVRAQAASAPDAPGLAPLVLTPEAKRSLAQLENVRRALPPVWTPYNPDGLFPKYKQENGDVDHGRLQKALKGFARNVERASRDNDDPTLRAIHAKADAIQGMSLVGAFLPSMRSRQLYGALKDFRVSVPNPVGADRELVAALAGAGARVEKLKALGGLLTVEKATERVAAEKARIDAQNPFIRFITGGRGKQKRLDEALAALGALDVAARQKSAQGLVAQAQPIRQAAGAATTIAALATSERDIRELAKRVEAFSGSLEKELGALEALKRLGAV